MDRICKRRLLELAGLTAANQSECSAGVNKRAMSEVLDVVKPQAQSSGRETTIKAMTQNGRRLDSDRQRQDL